MASHHGILPASKEVVSEIQLNKLINDFLFSGVENRNAAGAGDAEGRDESRPMIPSHDDPTWNLKIPPWKIDKPSCISLENGSLIESMGNAAHPLCVSDVSCTIRENAPPKMPYGSKCMPTIQSKPTSLPTLEEVRLDMPEERSNSCNQDKPQHTNKLKVFRLSRAHSVAGSLFCFAMGRQEQHGAKNQEEKKPKPERGNIKLTRIGSLPCHSKLLSEAEKEVKHTCRKPPRPPRSSSGKGPCPLLSGRASADAIFVLHSISRRARLERRKKHAASSSSNASMWALIFTFCFAMAMLGEGTSLLRFYFSVFWTQSSTELAVDASSNATAAHSHTNLNVFLSSLKTKPQNNLNVSSQHEKELQMREFWISKGLDPS